MHLDYDHLYIPLTSKWGKFLPQIIFLGNKNPFSIKYTVVRIKISCLKSLYLFQSGQNNAVKIWAFHLPGAFPDIYYDIDYTDETVAQCDIPVILILLCVLIIYKWPQINSYLNTYGLFLDPILFIVFCLLRSWSM